jgi:uncharacterized protein
MLRSPASRVVLPLCCAVGVWASFLNRLLLNLSDSILKTGAILLLATGLGVLALRPLWSSSKKPARLWPWLALLVLMALGEARRVWLRNDYRVESPPAASLFTPVTTTALRVSRFELRVPGLPVPRVRFAQLTDLHVTNALPESHRDHVLQELAALSPDVIVMTGDYISVSNRVPLLAEWLSGLPRARLGAFGVLGNHDYWTGEAVHVRETLEQAGVSVLTAECRAVALDSAHSLALCGTDAPWGPALEPAQIQAAKRNALATFALSHTPDNIYDFAALGVDAVFSGHTHGGQIRVPGLGALIVPSRYGRRFDQGRFQVERTPLFVSAGIGADAPPLRLWCPPEILVVDLLPAPPAE